MSRTKCVRYQVIEHLHITHSTSHLYVTNSRNHPNLKTQRVIYMSRTKCVSFQVTEYLHITHSNSHLHVTNSRSHLNFTNTMRNLYVTNYLFEFSDFRASVHHALNESSTFHELNNSTQPFELNEWFLCREPSVWIIRLFSVYISHIKRVIYMSRTHRAILRTYLDTKSREQKILSLDPTDYRVSACCKLKESSTCHELTESF